MKGIFRKKGTEVVGENGKVYQVNGGRRKLEFRKKNGVVYVVGGGRFFLLYENGIEVGKVTTKKKNKCTFKLYKDYL